MLVISRRKGEAIRIGEDIVITIAEIMPGKVRLGISAPQGVRIVRDNAQGNPGSQKDPSLLSVQEKQKIS